MLNLPVYLDHNATTPCDSRVVEAMLPYFTRHFGNAASRNHIFGWQAEEAVELAREQVAQLIGADPKEIIFTSGATEAVNLAIKGVYEMYGNKGKHIITCNIEHRAVLDTCMTLEKKGAEITRLPVDANGQIDLAELETSIRPDTILVAIMHANNEIGTLMPVKEIGDITRKHGVLFFTDATQAAGKIMVDVNHDQADLLCMSAHKMYGPKGVGALYVRRRNPRVKLVAQMDGGGHEKGMRSGTLNVPGIVGFGKACALCMNEMAVDAERLSGLRGKLEEGLLKIGGAFINGGSASRLPHVSNVSFKNVDGEALMMGINKEIAISSGSACTSASMEPSYVLKALGIGDELAHSSLRFGLGRQTTEEEITFTMDRVSQTVKKLREMNLHSLEY